MKKFITKNTVGAVIIFIVLMAILNRVFGIIDPELMQEIVRYLAIVGILVGVGYVLFKFIRK